jgi:hypothetical protein
MTIGFDIHEGSTLTAGLAGPGMGSSPWAGYSKMQANLSTHLFDVQHGSQHASFALHDECDQTHQKA